jgi:DNA-directed RNA polymerase beta subunit
MFGKIHEVAEMPNLIEVQKQSYDQFLMVEEPEGGRQDEGLQAVFRSVFPIKISASAPSSNSSLCFRAADTTSRSANSGA